MKKIGVSIPWDYLAENIVTKGAAVLRNIYGHSDQFLKFIKDLGVTHIELRHRMKNISDGDMDAVFRRLLDFNLLVTIHGDDPVKGQHLPLREVFPWLDLYRKINKSNNPVMVTLHPFTGTNEELLEDYNRETVSFIKGLDDTITKENLPLRLALENQRSKKNSISGTSFHEIDIMWREINRANVGICWDMGHCAANYRTDSNRFPLYPEKEFVTAATHTHIHDIGPDGKTHWLFKENIVPLSNYVQSLKQQNYNGVYNLEFSFNRFRKETEQKEQMEKSITKLRNMIQTT